MTISIYDLEVSDDDLDIYDVTFYDDEILTIVTSTPYQVDEWISKIEHIHRYRLHRLIVGLDVEWLPYFYNNSQNPVAVLQLCVGRRCLIFQIIHSPFIPISLVNFLRNANYTFVGVGIEEDVNKLRVYYNLCVARVEDLRPLAVQKYDVRELYIAGLKGLTRRVLEKDVAKPKSISFSKWDNRWLSPEQVKYACVDAFLSFEIGRRLIYGELFFRKAFLTSISCLILLFTVYYVLMVS